MQCLRVQIVRFVMEHQPNIIECRLTEATGRERAFIGKCAYFTADDLDADSVYPQPGLIACEVIGTHQDQQGRTVVTVDTERPWGIEDTEDETRFVVLPEQLTAC